jgi:hypothetical protein
LKIEFNLDSKNPKTSSFMPNWQDSSWSDETGFGARNLAWAVGKGS